MVSFFNFTTSMSFIVAFIFQVLLKYNKQIYNVKRVCYSQGGSPVEKVLTNFTQVEVQMK